jgi:hypothetical protein
MTARVVTIVTCVLVAAGTAQASVVTRIAERGPATFLVGTGFTLISPISAMASAVRGQSAALPLCRFGHGLKMVAAGAVLLPTGLLLIPFDLDRLPSAWLDGIVDSQQEDYCTRPFTAVLP